jgi:hypothetical protein
MYFFYISFAVGPRYLTLLSCFGWATGSSFQEIVSIYPLLQNPALLTPAASNRCCNALALLQCVASHMETRTLFLNAHVPLFLYPFLNTTHTHRPFEYVRGDTFQLGNSWGWINPAK